MSGDRLNQSFGFIQMSLRSEAEWRDMRRVIHLPTHTAIKTGQKMARKVPKIFPAVFSDLRAGGCTAFIGRLLLRRLGCEEAADGLLGEAEAGGGADHAGEFI